MVAPAVVFDLDGTLIDSAPDICAMGNRVLAEEDAGQMTLTQSRDYVGSGAAVFVRRMMAAHDLPEADHPRLLARFLELYEGAVKETTLYPGVEDALAVLGARGHGLGICTNKPISPTRKVLAHFGMSGRFGTVIGGDSLAVRKPDPAPVFAAFEELGAKTGLFVGDSEIDAAAAERAGAPFLLFTEGYRKSPVEEIPHAARFDHWDKLPGLVAEMAGRVA